MNKLLIFISLCSFSLFTIANGYEKQSMAMQTKQSKSNTKKIVQPKQQNAISNQVMTPEWYDPNLYMDIDIKIDQAIKQSIDQARKACQEYKQASQKSFEKEKDIQAQIKALEQQAKKVRMEAEKKRLKAMYTDKMTRMLIDRARASDESERLRNEIIKEYNNSIQNIK